MELFGLILDQATNEAAVTISAGTIIAISPPEGRCRVFVAGIEEEKTIARETVSCLAR
jgi:acetate kinase